MMGLIEEIIVFFSSLLDIPNVILTTINLSRPFLSSLFIFCVSVGVSIFSVSVSRKLIDVDKLKRMNVEIKRHNALKMKAMRGTDNIAIKKYELEKDEMGKLQREMMKMRFKPMLYTIIPLMLVFALMNGYYGAVYVDPETGQPGPDPVTGTRIVAAILPFPFIESLIIFPLGWNVHNAAGNFLYFQMSYIGWYFTISISVGAVIQKIAGLTP
ncbi:MAG: EMC3/TMCO1 family protein [Candidatus Hodarchaeales archaeon]|jgi:uncharacterized membrane protein (DUF106 family)